MLLGIRISRLKELHLHQNKTINRALIADHCREFLGWQGSRLLVVSIFVIIICWIIKFCTVKSGFFSLEINNLLLHSLIPLWHWQFKPWMLCTYFWILVTTLLKKLKQQSRETLEERRPQLTSALQKVPLLDFMSKKSSQFRM